MDYFNKYYTLNQELISFTGMWPFDETLGKSIRMYITIFLLSSTMLYQFHRLFKARNLDTIMQSLFFIIPDLCIAIAYFTVLFSPKKMKNIVNFIKHDWHKLLSKQDIIIMEKYANDSKLYTICVTGFLFSFAVLSTITPLFSVFMYYFNYKNDTTLKLIMPAPRFTEPNIMYITLLAQQSTVGVALVAIAAAVYSGLLMGIQHACSLFSVLVARINEPFQNDGACIWSSDRTDESYRWIVDVTKRYEEVITFVDMLNSLIEFVYLVEAFLMTLLNMIIFIYLFQLSTLLRNIVEALTILSYIAACLLIFYMNCVVGQRLIDHSLQVLETSSHVPFYDIPPKCHKPLLLLMMRSMKPCKVSVGGLFAVSHSFFSEIMQKSYSYAMVCYTMR